MGMPVDSTAAAIFVRQVLLDLMDVAGQGDLCDGLAAALNAFDSKVE